MNKIDEIIQKWGNREEAYRLYRLVLFDYYLTRYFELTERKLDGIKHHGINDKALINLLFVCLNSVEKESCGLFEAFRNFKIVCGWSRRTWRKIDSQCCSGYLGRFHIACEYQVSGCCD